MTGDVLFFRTLGQAMIVLGSARVAFELLEKRSANYSDRPQSPMFNLYLPIPHFQRPFQTVLTRVSGLVGNGTSGS